MDLFDFYSLNATDTRVRLMAKEVQSGRWRFALVRPRFKGPFGAYWFEVHPSYQNIESITQSAVHRGLCGADGKPWTGAEPGPWPPVGSWSEVSVQAAYSMSGRRQHDGEPDDEDEDLQEGMIDVCL